MSCSPAFFFNRKIVISDMLRTPWNRKENIKAKLGQVVDLRTYTRSFYEDTYYDDTIVYNWGTESEDRNVDGLNTNVRLQTPAHNDVQ